MASTSDISGNDSGGLACPQSRWNEIWERHEKQWKRLDELEERIDESVMRKRRRLANVLDETSTHRQSHLRLFVTHNVASGGDSMPVPSTETCSTTWKLVVEGRLLVGHLDHASAAQVEREAAEAAGVTPDQQQTVGLASGIDPSTGLPMFTGTSITGAAASTFATGAPGVLPISTPGISALQQQQQLLQQQQQVLVRSTDRTQYRGISEKEGDVSVEPVKFTHFFDKMTVTFQTIHQPRTTTSNATSTGMSSIPSSSSKKSRSKPKRKSEGKKTSAAALAAEQQRKLRSLTANAPSTSVVWNRLGSMDAHAFHVKYQEPPPPSDKATHSIAATITLYPRPGPEPRYQPSQALASALFPQHAMEDSTRGSKKRKAGSSTPSKKRRPETPTATSGEAQAKKEIPTDNDILVPPSLSMKEIVSAICFYAQEKDLTDESDRTIVVNDKVLAKLFDCERLNLFELQQRLLSQNLVTPLRDVVHNQNDKPIVLTYVMTRDTATTTTTTTTTEQEDEINNNSSMLTFDTNIYVEGLFHSRVRDLMRRIKRREFEYTSSRTRARNMLSTSYQVKPQEDMVVKSRIEQVVCGRGYSVDHVPVWLALAKAAPAQSEARAAALLDAQTCVLLDRLQQHVTAAKQAWNAVHAITSIEQAKESENKDKGTSSNNGDAMELE